MATRRRGGGVHIYIYIYIHAVINSIQAENNPSRGVGSIRQKPSAVTCHNYCIYTYCVYDISIGVVPGTYRLQEVIRVSSQYWYYEVSYS